MQENMLSILRRDCIIIYTGAGRTLMSNCCSHLKVSVIAVVLAVYLL